MKKLMLLFASFLAFTSFSDTHMSVTTCYTSDYVEISSVKQGAETYQTVTMRRDGDRVKAKYFAARDRNGSSVYERFQQWKSYNPNVIVLSSGTYFDDSRNPQGLTIDNGIIVNSNLIHDGMDALVIVYATGGIAVTDLRNGDLTVSGITRKLNIRSSPRDYDDFITWAQSQEATVFQTHLLAYKNQIRINAQTSNPARRERRFLAVGKDDKGRLLHTIIQYPTYASLYEASSKTLQFLQDYKDMEIIFMINLDTGGQDVFEMYNANCTVNTSIKGQLHPSEAANILTYYYK